MTILESPEVRFDLAFIWQSFWLLHTHRMIGAFGGMFPLPYLTIREYAEREYNNQEDIEEFIEIIMKVDSAYRDWETEREHKKKQNQEASRGQQSKKR